MVKADIVFATTVAVTTEAFINPVAGELARRGHCVNLVAGDRLPSADYEHTSAILPMNRGISINADLAALRAWTAHLTAIKPQMIVTGTPKASLLGLTAARFAGVPTRVYVLHGAVWDGANGVRRRVLESAERATIASSTHQVAVSDSLARLVRTRRLSRPMPTVLGSGSFCGVDTNRFSPSSSPATGLRMCYIGRISRDKGIDVLLRTLDRVLESADVRLTVVGGLDSTAPPDSDTLDLLTTHPHVDWVGESQDVPRYLRDSALLLFPTAREGLPQVALEAQACGVPVVSWRVTGVIDAVIDGFTGVLVGYGDEQSLANSATALLRDSDYRNRISILARQHAVNAFASSAVVPRTADYLECALSGTIKPASRQGAPWSKAHRQGSHLARGSVT